MTQPGHQQGNNKEPEIEIVLLEELVPYARNAKMHGQSQILAVAGSIREFGFCNPVLIDGDSTIIAGHCRVLAAEKAGLTEIPCIRLAHLNENQRKAYIIADNRLSEMGSWDYEMLRLEVEAIDFSKLDNMKLEDFQINAPKNSSPPEGTNPDTAPEKPGISGDDNRAHRIILAYQNESEKELWLERTGLDGKKVVYIMNEAGEIE
jgi:ParB-like chromosome segregation protein Spo0J